MCGRYASFREAQALADAFGVEEMTDAARRIAASWNVAPTHDVRVVLDRPGAENRVPVRSMESARWGLVPHWAKSPEIGSRMINARSETLAEKPAFRGSLRSRRCLVLADGYYEWHRYTSYDARERRQPYYIHPTADDPLAFAGLYAWWPDPARSAEDPDRWLLTTTIVTAEATGPLGALHHREPVMLPQGARDAWLDRSVESAHALEVLRSAGPEVDWYPVATAVGSVRNDYPGLLTPVTPPVDLARE